MQSRSLNSLMSVVAAGCTLLVGCTPSARHNDIESGTCLNQLDAFVGRWDVTGQARLVGGEQRVSFTGTNEVQWEGGGGYLVGRGVTTVGTRPATHGMAAWTYDATSRKLRTVSVSSTGAVAIGTAWYDGRVGAWYMETTSRGPEGRLVWKGKIEFLDRDTKDERWTGYALGGLIKKVEMTKTETRRWLPSRRSPSALDRPPPCLLRP